MAKILRTWNRISAADRIDFGASIKSILDADHSVVPADHADYTDFTAKFTALQARAGEVSALEGQLRTARLVRDTAMDAWLPTIEQLATTIESLSRGVPAAISSTGFAPDEGGSSAPVEMTQVQNFSVTAGDEDGELDYHHDRVAGARLYERQSATDPNGTAWTDRGTSTKSKGSVSGLTSGTRIWLRARAVGATGPGPWSAPASKIVP